MPLLLLPQLLHLLLTQPLLQLQARLLLLQLRQLPSKALTSPVQTGVANKKPRIAGFFVGQSQLAQFCRQQFEDAIGLTRLLRLTAGIQHADQGLSRGVGAQTDGVL